ncbi:Na(+)-translocating NADH-quinone reductase subunit F [Peptococcaceae bacterium CEB3]|nr:Na(+)-translocating NADH-quinone reductase subunit F [Peptococcaceae bacterium CEB3]
MRITVKPDIVLEANTGESLLDVLVRNKLYINNVCNGKGTCGKCKVRLVAGLEVLGHPAPSPAERDHLTERELAGGVRLACQVPAKEGMRLELENTEAYDRKEAALKQMAEVVTEPGVSKVFLQVPRPSLEDERGDWDRLADRLREVVPGLASIELTVSLAVLTNLGEALRAEEFTITATLWGNRVLAVEAGNTADRLYGVAIDIGTTSVGAALVDLKRGAILNVLSTENAQTAFGADVISRISYASKGDVERQQLRNSITETVNNLLDSLMAVTKVNRADILKLTFVGNTTMHHLFLGLRTDNLAVSPYVSARNRSIELTAAELKLRAHPEAVVLMFPNIGSFVGGDTVGAVIGASEIMAEGNHLLIDLGTNCELFLKTPYALMACSTAAGPAFEGAGITQGTRAKPGAIEGIQITEKGVEPRIIGRQAASGICGSGLIEAVAQMRKSGVINKKGAITVPEEDNKLAAFLKQRIRTRGNNGREFVLASGGDDGVDVAINQKDIGELQMAKGAVCAGIKTIASLAGITLEELDSVILAGTFATYVNVNSVVEIGLVPSIDPAKIKTIGNAAHLGAIRALLNQTEFARATELANQVQHIELGGNKVFTSNFMKSMYIEQTQ